MSENKKIINPNYKIGIKTLTEKQLNVGLPTYSIMKSKIEEIRSKVASVNRQSLSDEIFEALKYDQIFSVIGGRGAGKTSILFTIYNAYKEKDYNIVLPIIMPELIDNDENIISWLISSMMKNLNDVEEKINHFGICNKSNRYTNMCNHYKLFERCAFNKQNVLRQKFEELKERYYSKATKSFGNDYSESRQYQAISGESSFMLMQKFVDYWNALIDVYNEYIQENSKITDKKQPLIFIFIDDADLKPQIINELLFAIPKYLSHPNIVVFVSAAHKTLTYAVKNYMYKSIIQTPFDLPKFMEVEYLYNGQEYKENDGNITKYHDLKYGKEYDKIKRLSDEILRKLFPVYNRYYLKKYDRYEDKKLLRIFKNNDLTCEESTSLSEKMAILISDFCKNVDQMHKRYHKKDDYSDILKAKWENFSIIPQFNPKHPVEDLSNDYYLSFFGQYPRDMVAVYYALEDMLDDFKNILFSLYNNKNKSSNSEEMFLQPIYEIIIKFLSCAITSNRKLSVFSKYVRDLVKTRLLHWQLFVDYAKVIEIFKDSKYIQANKKNIDAFVEMITLLNFVEQFIVLIMPQRKRSNGYREFIQLMNLSEIKMIRCDCELDLMLKQYYKYHALGIIPKFDINNREHQTNFLRGANSLNLTYDYYSEERNGKHKKYPLEWYEFVAQIAVKRFQCVGRITEYRDELKIFKTEKFLGDNYRYLFDQYYEKLKSILFKEDDSEKVPIKNNAIVYEMEKNIISLTKIIGNVELEVQISESDLRNSIESSANSLDYIDNRILKKEVASFITYIYSSNPIRRNVIISRMNSIKFLIETYNEDYMELSVWYAGFEKILDETLKMKNIPNNQEFEEILTKIQEQYESYIKYYYSLICNDVEKEKDGIIGSNYLDYKKLGKEVETLIDIAKEREWINFFETE